MYNTVFMYKALGPGYKLMINIHLHYAEIQQYFNIQLIVQELQYVRLSTLHIYVLLCTMTNRSQLLPTYTPACRLISNMYIATGCCCHRCQLSKHTDCKYVNNVEQL